VITSFVNRNQEDLFLEHIVKAIRDIERPWRANKIGRPQAEWVAVITACCIKLFFNKTYEATEAYCKNSERFKKLTGSDAPSQSVIHRGMQKLPKKHIKKLNNRLTAGFRRKGISVVLDATGLKLRTSSLWYDIRIKKVSRKKDFTKLHIVGCVGTGIIHNYTITGGRAHDSPQLKELVSVIDRIIKAAGDKAYCARKNCTEIGKKGGKPFFKLKVNVTAKPKSSPEWKAMIRLYRKDPESWLKEYHVRSFVEAIFSSIKKRFGNFLRSVKKSMQEKELALKVVCYNVVRILYVNVAKELGVPLWVKAKR
jgi:transposase